MTIPEVEKVANTKLKPYVLDTTSNILDSLRMKKSSEYYTCKYQDLTLLLTFFRFTLYKQTDFELVGITPYPASSLIQTKSGIGIGISEKKFLKICKESGFLFNIMGTNKKINCYQFSDSPPGNSAKTLMLYFSDGILTSLMVINMIGD